MFQPSNSKRDKDLFPPYNVGKMDLENKELEQLGDVVLSNSQNEQDTCRIVL